MLLVNNIFLNKSLKPCLKPSKEKMKRLPWFKYSIPSNDKKVIWIVINIHQYIYNKYVYIYHLYN